jgi:FKBP-type peptidyl-prolyl cis-trans isomerase FkpA
MMKIKYIFLLFVGLLASSCQLGQRTPCDPTPVVTNVPQSEVMALKQYIDSKGIKATANERGFYYSIQKPGSGAKPTICSNVTVNYKGTLTNGESFDSGNDISFGLNQLVLGWQVGIPLVAPGGSVTLYLPPSLAYGSQEQSGIPANSILVFEIDLVKVSN